MPPFKKEDRYAEFRPELTEIHFHHFWKQKLDGKQRRLTMDKAVVIQKGVFGNLDQICE